jgi:hypothetical protein
MILIKRLEFTQDNQGRPVTVETTVFHLSVLVNDTDNMHTHLIEENVFENNVFRELVQEYMENETDEVLFCTSTDEGAEFEVTGEVCLEFLNRMKAKGYNLDNLWKEDGVTFLNNKFFNVSTQHYAVEVVDY